MQFLKRRFDYILVGVGLFCATMANSAGHSEQEIARGLLMDGLNTEGERSPIRFQGLTPRLNEAGADLGDILSLDQESLALFSPSELTAAIFASSKCRNEDVMARAGLLQFSNPNFGSHVYAADVLRANGGNTELAAFARENPELNKISEAPFVVGNYRPFIGVSDNGDVHTSCGGSSTATIDPEFLDALYNIGGYTGPGDGNVTGIKYSTGGEETASVNVYLSSFELIEEPPTHSQSDAQVSNDCVASAPATDPSDLCYADAAALYYRGSYVCSGVINGQSFLTAAHCVCPGRYEMRYNSLTVRIGNNVDIPNPVEFRLLEGSASRKEWVEFRAGETENTYCEAIALGANVAEAAELGDVVMLKFDFDDDSHEDQKKFRQAFSGPILSRGGFIDGTGWSAMSLVSYGENADNEYGSQTYVALGINDSSCRAAYQVRDITGDYMTQVCYPDHEFVLADAGAQRDSCRGDSGGPVYVRDLDGNSVLVGVASRAHTLHQLENESCNGLGGIYTNLTNRRISDWLATHLESPNWIDRAEIAPTILVSN